jgi:hypothetical protein
MWRHHQWLIALIGGLGIQGCALSTPTLSPEMQATIQSMAQHLCHPCPAHQPYGEQPSARTRATRHTLSPEVSPPVPHGSEAETGTGHEP